MPRVALSRRHYHAVITRARSLRIDEITSPPKVNQARASPGRQERRFALRRA